MPQHLLFAVIALCGLIVLTSLTFSWLSMEFLLPLVSVLMSSLQRKENLKTQETMSNNLSFMATRVGELQAQVIQLDSLGERLSKLAGVGRESAPPVKAQPKSDGQGGPFIATHATYTDLQQQIERLTQLVESKTDELSMLESRFLEKRVRERLLPTMLPVTASRIGSGYGYRSDPLAGVRAMHEGIDFVAPAGTPILAAAAGVVVVAEYHNAFGNMVDIDHGDGLISRYAHMSQIALKSGQMVRRGQRVGLVGSTGRSTGPHLHFEVRMMGVAQNPAVLLRQGDNFAQAQTP
jgi:murein DD-endopeptidase MepM/ murein hydrolase activator NlpD